MKVEKLKPGDVIKFGVGKPYEKTVLITEPKDETKKSLLERIADAKYGEAIPFTEAEMKEMEVRKTEIIEKVSKAVKLLKKEFYQDFICDEFQVWRGDAIRAHIRITDSVALSWSEGEKLSEEGLAELIKTRTIAALWRIKKLVENGLLDLGLDPKKVE